MKTIGVISTDWHIDESNQSEVYELVLKQVEIAKREGLSKIFCLGDVFDSRQKQSERVLNTFTSILEYLEVNNMYLICVPGNHDKTDYRGYRSFLSPFKNRPYFSLVEEFKVLENFEGTNTHVLLIPFYSEDEWLERLEEASKFLEARGLRKGDTILMSHQALTGSVNNDGSKVENSIKPGMLSDFKAVFLGHYHDYQEITASIIHCPSIRQKNFGENPNKGYTLIKDTGEYDIELSEFKQYYTMEYDASDLDPKFLEELKKEVKETDMHVRIKVRGEAKDVKSLDLNSLRAVGVKVEVKSPSIEKSVEECNGEIEDYSSYKLLKELFEEFCESRKLDKEEGTRLLKLIVKENE